MRPRAGAAWRGDAQFWLYRHETRDGLPQIWAREHILAESGGTSDFRHGLGGDVNGLKGCSHPPSLGERCYCDRAGAFWGLHLEKQAKGNGIVTHARRCSTTGCGHGAERGCASSSGPRTAAAALPHPKPQSVPRRCSLLHSHIHAVTTAIPRMSAIPIAFPSPPRALSFNHYNCSADPIRSGCRAPTRSCPETRPSAEA